MKYCAKSIYCLHIRNSNKIKTLKSIYFTTQEMLLKAVT